MEELKGITTGSYVLSTDNKYGYVVSFIRHPFDSIIIISVLFADGETRDYKFQIGSYEDFPKFFKQIGMNFFEQGEMMRIDLPQCNLKNCRVCLGVNCTDKINM